MCIIAATTDNATCCDKVKVLVLPFLASSSLSDETNVERVVAKPNTIPRRWTPSPPALHLDYCKMCTI